MTPNLSHEKDFGFSFLLQDISHDLPTYVSRLVVILLLEEAQNWGNPASTDLKFLSLKRQQRYLHQELSLG